MSESTIRSMYEMVKEFQREVLKYPLPEKPYLANEAMLVGQLSHAYEELDEAEWALADSDIVSYTDAIADAIYVLMGMAARCGLPLDEAFAVVHAANMKKQTGITKRGMAFDAIKPEGWEGPEAEIRKLLNGE